MDKTEEISDTTNLIDQFNDEIARMEEMVKRKCDFTGSDVVHSYHVALLARKSYAEKKLSDTCNIFSILKKLEGRTIKSVQIENNKGDCEPVGTFFKIRVISEQAP